MWLIDLVSREAMISKQSGLLFVLQIAEAEADKIKKTYPSGKKEIALLFS